MPLLAIRRFFLIKSLYNICLQTITKRQIIELYTTGHLTPL